jgi:RsiW-degrading membrane proteinase PrsW (M82 family)
VRGLESRQRRRRARGILASALGLVACVCSACSPHLAGTHDEEMEYSVRTDPVTGKSAEPELAAALVKGRINAALTPAEVDVTAAGTVRVVVDDDAADSVDALLRWRGGLDAYVVDDAGALRKPPVTTLGVGESAFTSVGPALHGRGVALGLPAGATTPIAAAASAEGARRFAFVRDRSLLATTPADQAAKTPLVLSFGDDILAYTRAYHARLLLESSPVPPLERKSTAAVAPRWGLAAACALLPLAISLAWLAFVRRFDRARPEPVWLVMATFALGALAVVPAGLLEYALGAATPWLDPSIATLGGQVVALPLAAAVSTLVVGVSEEGAKLLAVWALPFRRREFDEPVDGIVYACAAALGFAAAENVKYFAFGRMSGSVIAIRSFLTVPAHMFFAALWGYALGQTLVSRKPRVLAYAGLAALVHGVFDSLLSIGGLQVGATLLVLALAVVFVALLRRSLAHGVVEREPLPPPGRQAGTGSPADASRPRASWRIGSRGAFYAYATGMVLSAFMMTVLGTAYEVLQHRVGLVFVTVASTVLAAFGAAAYGVSATVPLDAVVDAEGITFSGARTAWSALRSAAVAVRGRRAFLVMGTDAGEARIGPTTEAQAGQILAAMRAHWSG